jgi:hypothetical protein
MPDRDGHPKAVQRFVKSINGSHSLSDRISVWKEGLGFSWNCDGLREQAAATRGALRRASSDIPPAAQMNCTAAAPFR